MFTSVINSFLPKVFLSVSILFQLTFNIRLINNLKYNYPIVDQEVFYPTLCILISIFFLYTNLKIGGYFSNFLLINNEKTRIIKILIIHTIFPFLHLRKFNNTKIFIKIYEKFKK